MKHPTHIRQFLSSQASAFTLIELLVVVSIISILTLIALPNTTLAMTRAKVARAYNDMRVVSTGLELYAVDYNRYPVTTSLGRMLQRYHGPTIDIFAKAELTYENHMDIKIWGLPRVDDELQTSYTEQLGTKWILASVGPDKDWYNGLGYRYEGDRENGGEKFFEPITAPYRDYDPTNGTLSRGNIFRTSVNNEHLNGHPDLYKDVYVHVGTAYDR